MKYASSGVPVAARPFTGVWHCRYWFPSNNHSGDDVSEYYARIDRSGKAFVLHSLPNKLEAYMLARFTLDNNVATGTWLENTSPHAEFQGMIYSGAFQLFLDQAQTHMAGHWVGVGRDGANPKIYHGRWDVAYAGATDADVPPL